MQSPTHSSYRLIREQVNACPRTLAAPSWVWPGDPAMNCRKLAGLFPEVSLLLLETKACLAYGGQDLPPGLADLPLSYHAHLPMDLDWSRGAEPAMADVLALTHKVKYLSPHAFVLHPPPGDPATRRALLADAARLWRESGREISTLLLENTRDAGPVELLDAARHQGFGLCLDLGHMMAYEQALPALPELAGRVHMLHLSAPGPRAEHLPLTRLSPRGEGIMAELIQAAGRDAVLTIEVFEPQGLFESVGYLAGAFAKWSAT